MPQIVFDETTATQHDDGAARLIAGSSWIERAAPVPIPSAIVEWDLGPGESAVIALAVSMVRSRAVIDDLSGRRCALALGVDVMGTLGIVIAAYRRGHVEDPRQLILELRAAGMWLSDAVIDRALRLAG